MTIDFDFDLDPKATPKEVKPEPKPSPMAELAKATKPIIDAMVEGVLNAANAAKEATGPKDKPVLRQSNLQHYFTCPKKYQLALQYGDLTETTMAMRHGLIFERYVLGEKPDHNEADFKANVYGRIKGESLEYLKAQAEYAKPLFLAGTPYVKLRHETDEFIFVGEADFIGEVLFKGEAVECIGDLKYTSNISEYWNKKQAKSEYLQAITYPYLLWKMTGKLLPFIYVIVEDSFENPLIKQIRVDVKVEDFEWIERVIRMVVDDVWFEAVENANACLGFKAFGKCKFLQWCDEGKDLVCEPVELFFNQLMEIVNVN